MAREGALWMGDLMEYMDEAFIIEAFRSAGEDTVQNVKVMKNRYTGQAAGYCFVNFISDNAALTAMHKLNGKLINNSNPPTRFKLNHSSTRGATQEKEFSLWVGDLTPDVDDFALYKAFGSRYNSIKTAKVIYDPSGTSKGFAFVRFFSEDEFRDALTHMNNFKGLGGKPLKVSYAVPKKQNYSSGGGGNSDYSQQQSGAAAGPQQGAQQQYYDPYWNQYAWGGYGQGQDSQYYDVYGGGPGGNAEYETSNYAEERPVKDDFAPVEWNVPLDIPALNAAFIDQSEELWKTLEKQRWSFWEGSSLEA